MVELIPLPFRLLQPLISLSSVTFSLLQSSLCKVLIHNNLHHCLFCRAAKDQPPDRNAGGRSTREIKGQGSTEQWAPAQAWNNFISIPGTPRGCRRGAATSKGAREGRLNPSSNSSWIPENPWLSLLAITKVLSGLHRSLQSNPGSDITPASKCFAGRGK